MRDYRPISSGTRRGESAGGFTFVEMLVAMSISALVIGTGALVLGTITRNAKHFATSLQVSIGSTLNENFYDLSSDTIEAPAAPNYGRLGFVHELRDQFYEDVSRSEGVYCLARTGVNPLRPEWLPWPYDDPAVSKPVLDTPEAFRQYLATVEASTATTFTAYRNVPPDTSPNTSIFLIAPTDQADYLKVQAVYEIDYVPVTNPAGLYASVRRYKNGALTHYYDVFFENGPNTPLRPAFVAFESLARLANDEGTTIDRFKIARQSPFYLIWWPDPSVNPMTQADVPRPSSEADPKKVYGNLAGKTGFVLVAPVFPSL